MYFKTQSDWEDKNPAFAAFDDPKNPCHRWRAVELTVATYYYHVHFKLDSVGIDILLGNLDDVLVLLQDYPDSALSLQTPAWLNNGEPGLCRVVAIYKSSDPAEQTHIAECADGKMKAIDVLAMGKENLNLAAIDKAKIWTSNTYR